MQNIQNNYASERHNLSDAAKEIRDLLDTLAQDYNTTTETGQEKLMKDLGQEVQKHPKWRRALKEGGIELIKVLCAPIGVPLEMARVYLEEE
jgi:transposase